ncbi:MAG TPA: arginyltransferase [Terriglobia bacterium]|nr:arginyltransferase [Terriglobia bacterium]
MALNDLPQELLFPVTEPYPCSYLPDRMARMQIAVPAHRVGTEIYGDLLRRGFRRSGVIAYRPQCDQCRACVPARIPVREFRPSRSQARALTKHGDLKTTVTPLRYDADHFALYARYQASRHSGGDMDQNDRDQYSGFLLESNVRSHLVEFRDNDRLVMVSIIDELNDGLSAVYTFFATDVPGASFGTYSILWQIEQCRRASLPFLYLGYWIKESPKMSYKARFRPMETLINGTWQRPE